MNNYGKEIPEWVRAFSVFDFRQSFPTDPSEYEGFANKQRAPLDVIRKMLVNLSVLDTQDGEEGHYSKVFGCVVNESSLFWINRHL